MSTFPGATNLADITGISLALIMPDAGQRHGLAKMLAALNVPVRECTEYPNASVIDELINLGCDVFIVDLNADAERALGLIENICSHNSAATVMAYCSGSEPEMLMRSMRAGAREFLSAPVVPAVI